MNQLAASALVAKIQAVWADRPWSQTKVDQWADALEAIDERAGDATLSRLRISRDRCPTIAEFITAARPATAPRDGHPMSCLCGGAGWMTVTQHDDHSSWEAFTRCPDGPPTSFIESPQDYDPAAGAAAWETFHAFGLTADDPPDVQAAAFEAAGVAYRNAARTGLF